ncbi:MAG: hypothetical protein E2P06_05760 [Acidobacteria bacterium]|nr:MAG: hypothetical protein E2P06_05760 [Acidobacteriota bacterium]
MMQESQRNATGPKSGALPTRILPVLYFAFAHIALAVAFAAVAFDPVAVAGFFYHARIVAIVHLVTLGWISGSILGAVYIVGPLALRMPMPARRLDYWAWAFFTVGTMGMVSHFWTESFSGMAWSAAMVVLGFVLVSIAVLRRLRVAPINGAIKLHIALAFLNLLGAGSMGTLLGFDKVFHFLPGYVLSNVYAHAHLAAVGWALMMVVGVSYRMLPMVLPSAIPEGKSVYVSAVLLEIGVVGLFIALTSRGGWVPFFALVIAGGVAAFLGHVIWMTRHSRPAPAARPRPDYAVWHAVQALSYLALATVVGVGLAVAPLSEATLRSVLPYGVFGLIGFLAQIVVGIESRLLPLFAWYGAFANSGFERPLVSPHQMPNRAWQRLAFYLWVAGVPALAAGFYFNVAPVLATGAWCLLAAVVFGTLNSAWVLRHTIARPGRPSARNRTAPSEASKPA